MDEVARVSVVSSAPVQVGLGAAVGLLIGLAVAVATRPTGGPRPDRAPFAAVGSALLLGGAGIVAVTAACWAGFVLAGIGPVAVAVPAGVVVLGTTALLYLRAVPGGRLTPVWAFAAASGVALGLLAAALTDRFRVAGIASLIVLAGVASQAGPRVHARLGRKP